MNSNYTFFYTIYINLMSVVDREKYFIKIIYTKN